MAASTPVLMPPAATRALGQPVGQHHPWQTGLGLGVAIDDDLFRHVQPAQRNEKDTIGFEGQGTAAVAARASDHAVGRRLFIPLFCLPLKNPLGKFDKGGKYNPAMSHACREPWFWHAVAGAFGHAPPQRRCLSRNAVEIILVTRVKTKKCIDLLLANK
ncbi:MAG: hypothetical protein ACR2Q4_10275 [Geminicoccaceae bacterium]